MRTPEEVVAATERTVAQLAEEADLRWEWDERFSAVLGVVKAPGHLPLLELIGRLFPHAWDRASLATAPATIRAAAAAWGGLMGNQRLFTLEPTDDPLLFVAWWPWGGGGTFSLRLGCVGAAAGSAESALVDRIRECFAV